MTAPAIPPNIPQRPRARLASIAELQATLLPSYLAPVPSVKTCRSWFKAAGIPRLKPNPSAIRGGGTAFYSVAAVEKFLRSRSGLAGYGEDERGGR